MIVSLLVEKAPSSLSSKRPSLFGLRSETFALLLGFLVVLLFVIELFAPSLYLKPNMLTMSSYTLGYILAILLLLIFLLNPMQTTLSISLLALRPFRVLLLLANSFIVPT